MYFSPVVFEVSWESSGKTTCQMKQSAYVAQFPCHLAQLVRLRRLGCSGHVVHHNNSQGQQNSQKILYLVEYSDNYKQYCNVLDYEKLF